MGKPTEVFEVQQLRGSPDDKHELMWLGGWAGLDEEQVRKVFMKLKRSHPNRVYRLIKITTIE